MEVRRTVPVKLDADSDGAALLRETVDEFLWAANYVVDHAWQGKYKTTSKAQLQEETYDEVRDRTRLHANLVQNARNKAADAVQSVVARWKQGEYALYGVSGLVAGVLDEVSVQPCPVTYLVVGFRL